MLTRTRRRALLALVPLALVPLLVAATHGSRKLTALSCGQTITTSTTLSADLGPCGGNGVVIGADHVTLNLNGHRIIGNGSGTNSGVSSNNVGSIVENGSVIHFFNDVVLKGDSSRALNLRVSQAPAEGIVLGGGANDMASGNRAFANTEDGIISTSPGSQLTNNVLQFNGEDGLFGQDASVVSGNKAFSNGSSGIFFDNPGGASVTVTNNLANGNSDGIREVSGDPTVVTLTGNQAFFNTQLGIAAAAGVTDGGHNKSNSNGTFAQCTNIGCS
jgi:parallel beta-helix repeat protein